MARTKCILVLDHAFVRSKPGVNFINIPQVAFKCTDPESAKKTDNLTVFLRFWDLSAQKLLVKH